MKVKVGFIGLGLMGLPMASNILKKGFPLVVYNRTKSKASDLVKKGATFASSPQELASQVDVLITMVTAPHDVEEVLFGKFGVYKSAKAGSIIIDMSTIGPTAAKDFAKRLSGKNIDFLDAPVTGSTPKAITGELTIFVGGKEAVLKKANPVLEAMGTNIVYMGPAGSGQAIKLINNYFISASVNAMSESMVLADSMNLPREKVAQALEKTPNISPTIKLKMPNLVNKKFPLLFSLSNMRKDLGLAIIEMKKGKLKLPALIHVEKLLGKVNENKKLSNEDFTVFSKEVEVESKK